MSSLSSARPITRIGNPVLHRSCIDVRPNDIRFLQCAMNHKKILRHSPSLPTPSKINFEFHQPQVGETATTSNKLPNIFVSDANKRLHATLNKFRKDNGFGRAIACNQIGIPLNMIAMNVPGIDIRTGQMLSSSTSSSSITLLNPKITWVSQNHVREVWDDCFSFPEILVRCRRYKNITVEFDPAPAPGQTLPISFLPEKSRSTVFKSKSKSKNKRKNDEAIIENHILSMCKETKNVSEPFFPRMEWKCLDPNISELLQHETDHLIGLTSFDRLAFDFMNRRQDLPSSSVSSSKKQKQPILAHNQLMMKSEEFAHPYVITREEYLKRRDFYDSICKEWKY